MRNNTFLKLSMYSVIGLVISAISLVWTNWLEQPLGKDLSGIDLWVNLQRIVFGPEPTPDGVKQTIIFVLLTIIIASILIQSIITLLIYSQRRLMGWLFSAVLWAITLGCTLILLIAYRALVSGVFLMGIGSIVALLGELSIMFSGLNFERQDHKQIIKDVVQRWSISMDSEVDSTSPFAVLAVHTLPEITYNELQDLQKELRGRDLIYPVKNGFYILLWQNTPINTPIIANKLLNILQGNSTRQVQIGCACYPVDGRDLSLVLTHANQALQSAQKAGGSAIIPYSTPTNRNALSSLSAWESLVNEVKSTNRPAVILSFKTNRPLNLAETHRIQNEIRGRDHVITHDSGLYVFLWNTSRDGGNTVMKKLQSILNINKIENQALLASLPEDGENFPDLVNFLGN